MKLTAIESQLFAKIANIARQQHENDNIDAGADFALLICSDKIQIEANKKLLSDASKVFMAMFNTEMMEKKDDIVHITDIDSLTMNQLIDFIKSAGSKAPIFSSVDEIRRILYAAEKYDLFDLKIKCHEILVEQITMENIFAILEIADSFAMASLEAKCLLNIVR